MHHRPVPHAAAPALRVETVAAPLDAPLIPRTHPTAPLSFVRRGDGIVGVGEALRLEFSGPDRVARAADAWRSLAASASVTDAVEAPGTGLVAFGAFAFADESAATSVLVVPRVVHGRRGTQAWTTRIGAADDADAPDAAVPPLTGTARSVTFAPGHVSPAAYVDAVGSAVARITAGEVEKVVLARDMVADLPPDPDLRRLLRALATAYPDTWTYAVDGVLGSSPELLVAVADGTVRARVLAGSVGRGADAATDAGLAASLAASPKDLDEHGFAVRSVLAKLAPFSTGVVASELPFTLRLPNLWHLASDVEGVLAADAGVLDLVGALHPTAAVAGTPREGALAMIAELERGLDRRRYAGPVGWVDAAGDGEFVIALRGAEVSGGEIRAYAGAGVVGASVPERELAETTLKFRPIVDALSPDPA